MSALLDPDAKTAINKIQAICAKSDDGSRFYTPDSSGYMQCIQHFFESSTELSAAAVQPGSAETVSDIMVVLAEKTVKFAIKGGGHATCPTLSSTSGILVSMSSFKQIEYVPRDKTIVVGSGCLWDEVYQYLRSNKIKRDVVGGFDHWGVGVAGYILGGGYSFKTNQYGLAIDNVLGFQVVLPNGDITDVKENDPLFEALKGGGNNFGIVTQFTLKTHEQPDTVYEGDLSFEKKDIEQVKAALVDFSKNETNPKASVVATIIHSFKRKQKKTTINVKYRFNGKKPDKDPFQKFLDIKRIGAGGIEIQEHPYAPPVNAKVKGCARFSCIMISKFTKNLVDAIVQEAENAAGKMEQNRGSMVFFDVWPFLPSIFSHGSESAWPDKREKSFSPLLAYFVWEDAKDNEFWLGEMARCLKKLQAVAIQEGCTTEGAPLYPNNSLETTPVREIYRSHLEKLGRVRAKYDPKDVMANAGGFRIPLVK